MSRKNVEDFYLKIESKCKDIAEANLEIKEIISKHADGKNLKGDELVGWLGEVYAKFLLNGAILEADDKDYDVVAANMRVSVKARKGKRAGWTRTGIIPRIDLSEDSPTHLLFVHLNDDYSLKDAWCFDWEWLSSNSRFIQKKVRGSLVGHFFNLSPEGDKEFILK